MTEAWASARVADCLEPVSLAGKTKVQSRAYKPAGRFPVIDQGQEQVAGWTDDESAVIDTPLPLVVFGDHTRAFKFVDTPFARGADGTQLLRPKPDIDPLFFFYACRAVELPARGYNRHFTVLKEKELSYPTDEAEQKSIARVLSETESLLQTQSGLLETLKELKRAAMRELFARGLRGEAQKETEIGLVPESWESANLGGTCQVLNGHAFESKDYVASGLTNFRVVNIRDAGNIDLHNDVKFLPETFAVSHSEYLLSSQDILLVMVGATRGKLCMIEQEHLPALMNQNMWRIRPSTSRLTARFLYHQLTLLVPRHIAKYSQGMRGFLKKEEFRSEQLTLPAVDEQVEIVAILDAIERKINLHQRKRAVLEELFKSLLHKLMTGEIRVSELDLSALESAPSAG